jgi:hypothetical protein
MRSRRLFSFLLVVVFAVALAALLAQSTVVILD